MRLGMLRGKPAGRSKHSRLGRVRIHSAENPDEPYWMPCQTLSELERFPFHLFCTTRVLFASVCDAGILVLKNQILAAKINHGEC